MDFRDLDIKTEYRSLIDSVTRDFYIPVLKYAKLYQRAVGFFSSTALIEISKGISSLVLNGGKIQLVASPYLSDEDIEAIKKGYRMRDEVIKKAVLREMKTELDDSSCDKLNLLANLIADDILDIKIAFTENRKRMGMYHEKMGIITDVEGNKIAFSGSMNESSTAMTVNYETIDVYCSWKGEKMRVEAKEKAFASIWVNKEPNVNIIDFPELKQEIINRYKTHKIDYEEDIKYIDSTNSIVDFKTNDEIISMCNKPQIPNGFKFYEYQNDAINKWQHNGFRGVFDMATGTGKTYTGLGALTRLAEFLNYQLAVIIVCPYQHLVEQWVEDIEKFNIIPIIGYSASRQKDWKKRLQCAILDQKLKVKNSNFLCFICTNATYTSEFVQQQIMKIRSKILLMVDEAHNFGAPHLSGLLHDRYDYRLALSATISRHNDEEGTKKLFDFFGDKCIEYSLERAIDEKKLTPYMYYPVIVTLSEEELEAYNQLSYEMGKCLIRGANGKPKLSKKGEILALKRARIVAGARGKLEALEREIKPYQGDSHILVYCGATKGLEENQDKTSVDLEELRQIDEVTQLLGNKMQMDVSQFTSKEDMEERAVLQREISLGDNLKVLVAIKCLDEGVNIPKIKTAFILASTTNPKEYIQRRGRVLRLAEGKRYAEIFDFITLPYSTDDVISLTEQQIRRCITLVKSEINRATEFSRLSNNMIYAENILDEIREAYSLNNYNFIEGDELL